MCLLRGTTWRDPAHVAALRTSSSKFNKIKFPKRRRKKLLVDLKDRRGYSHLKEEALDRTMLRHRFGGGFGPVVRQNTE